MDSTADRHQSSMNGSQGHSDLSRRRRLLILVICSMSLLIVGLDVTIVNVALPAIHRSLGASVSGLQWTIDAYTLTIASPADAVGVDRRPDRAAQGVPDRLGRVLGGFAAVRAGTRRSSC